MCREAHSLIAFVATYYRSIPIWLHHGDCFSPIQLGANATTLMITKLVNHAISTLHAMSIKSRSIVWDYAALLLLHAILLPLSVLLSMSLLLTFPLRKLFYWENLPMG